MNKTTCFAHFSVACLHHPITSRFSGMLFVLLKSYFKKYTENVRLNDVATKTTLVNYFPIPSNFTFF